MKLHFDNFDGGRTSIDIDDIAAVGIEIVDGVVVVFVKLKNGEVKHFLANDHNIGIVQGIQTNWTANTTSNKLKKQD